jgi:hypothetical protein
LFQASSHWEQFEAGQTVAALPGRIGNYDEFIAEGWRPDFVGMTLRVYDPRSGLWSIFWLSNRGDGIDPANGTLTAPVVGRFEGDRGLFEGSDQLQGRPIRVRFEWRRIDPDRASWQRSFSADGGATWETNWTMQLTRERPADRRGAVTFDTYAAIPSGAKFASW